MTTYSDRLFHLGGVPVSTADMVTGNVFFVGSDVSGATDGGVGYGEKPSTPYATLDYAVGKCTANNGDRIYLMPSHSESLTADSAVDIDVAGVTVIGVGEGSDRPTFTFTTVTTADFKIAAANVTIENILFVNDITNQDMMIEVTGDDAKIINCEFREGSAKQPKTFITIGVADNDADRCLVDGCYFYMPTAGNGDAAISLAKDMTGVRIKNCEAYGDFDLACIDVPTGGNAQVDLVIKDCVLTNLLTGQHAIQVNGTSSTGKIVNVQCQTDDFTAAIDAGGLETYNVKWANGTDDASGINAMPISGGYIKVSASLSAATWKSVASHEIATVTGLCKVTVIPECSTTIVSAANASSTTIALGLADDTTLMIAATSIAGTSTFFNTGDIWTTSTTSSAMANGQMWTEIKDDLTVVTNGSDVGYTIGTSASVSGTIDFHIYWEPLEVGAKVVAGAGGSL